MALLTHLRPSRIGLLLGLFFFAASLTPSLVPRGWMVQGVLAGLVMAIGYMLARFIHTCWKAAALPEFGGRAAGIAHAIAAVPVLGIWLYTLLRATSWQNAIRERVAMEPVDSARTFSMLAVALAVFLVCFLIGSGIRLLFDVLRERLDIVLPRRTANVLGLLLAGLLLLIATRDGIMPRVIAAVDSSYEAGQDLFETAPPPPEDGRIPGSAGSLVDWQAMGQPGRDFVVSGPDAADIAAYSGRPALDPIRVYVGRAEAETPDVRADIALAELLRLGAFERDVLVVASPTGTGWLDPGSHDVVEYMHDGDVATVAVQYSYLQSPLALIFETDTGLEQANATVSRIYDHWKSLPDDSRPDFYLHGISLGAWSSMNAFDVFHMIGDPIQGALWTGPPFPSELWRRFVDRRDPGSPYVLPEVDDGALVRFMSQFGGLDRATADWGPLRIIYMQHASDPIVFFEPASGWRKPTWMDEPPAPDVSPRISFMPVVTQVQLAFDMLLANGLPEGYGHRYGAAEYVEAWAALTSPAGWSEAATARLQAFCTRDDATGCPRAAR